MLLKKGATRINPAICYAIKYGHNEIVNFLLDKVNKPEKILYVAARYNNLIILQKSLFSNYNPSGTDINIIMRGAARGGNLQLVERMVDNGANSFDDGFPSAIKGGNLDVVKLFISKGISSFDNTIKYAAKCGHIEILKILIENGATNFDDRIIYASKYGHLDIVKLLIVEHSSIADSKHTFVNSKELSTDLNDAIRYAIIGKYIDIVEFLLTQQYFYVPIICINRMMEYACDKGYTEIALILFEKGGNDFTSAIEAASSGGHLKLVKFFSTKTHKYGNSILYATNNKHKKVVKFLSSLEEYLSLIY